MDPIYEMELAEAAYTAYGNHRGWVVATGKPMPRWSEQAMEFQAAWAVAMQGVLAKLEADGKLR